MHNIKNWFSFLIALKCNFKEEVDFFFFKSFSNYLLPSFENDHLSKCQLPKCYGQDP